MFANCYGNCRLSFWFVNLCLLTRYDEINYVCDLWLPWCKFQLFYTIYAMVACLFIFHNIEHCIAPARIFIQTKLWFNRFLISQKPKEEYTKNRQQVLVILQFMILTNCISMPDVSLGIDGERLPRLVILADTWVHMRDPSDSIKNTLIALHIIKQFGFLRKTLYDN